MKRVEENDKQCLIICKCGCAYANVIFAVVESFQAFKTEATTTTKNDSTTQLVLYKVNFGWMNV
jgi:hypothetical protein